MRGTLATALLLAASSQTAAESNQINPQQVSDHVGTTLNKINTQSSPGRFLQDNREQRVALALPAADESRTINNAATSAIHDLMASSGTAAATRDVVREILDLNALPKEVGRPQFDLNFPPSETLAHLPETSDTSLRNHASTSTASEVAESSGRTNKQHTAPTRASKDLGHPPISLESSLDHQLKEVAALKAIEMYQTLYGSQFTPGFDKVYNMYLQHLQTISPKFDPTKEETKRMLIMFSDLKLLPLDIASRYHDMFRYMHGEELEVLKKKLGTDLKSTLDSLASLKLAPDIVQEIQRPFVWYESITRWRKMYSDFFEFAVANNAKIKGSVPGFEFHEPGTYDTKLLAQLKGELNPRSKTRKMDKLLDEVDSVMAEHAFDAELRAAVQKIEIEFCGKMGQRIPKRLQTDPTAASHLQPGNLRTESLPSNLRIPAAKKRPFSVVDSKNHSRKKRLRSS